MLLLLHYPFILSRYFWHYYSPPILLLNKKVYRILDWHTAIPPRLEVEISNRIRRSIKPITNILTNQFKKLYIINNIYKFKTTELFSSSRTLYSPTMHTVVRIPSLPNNSIMIRSSFMICFCQFDNYSPMAKHIKLYIFLNSIRLNCKQTILGSSIK